ncbi:MAG: pyridoxamine 5-phosphate oxidase [Clostridiales Family XIII bacterium]|jgi:uncharacterized pyridoxamine 5'-phosphate oxidase family protein|nr:pyridoxamine 5-phosphate oxidase [Clostridiales Family XIII bacterium]
MDNLKRIVDFLHESVFYVATVDENEKPKVRPFGAIGLINGKLCICTNSTKNVSKQFKTKTAVEIARANEEGLWLRLTADIKLNEDKNVKVEMFRQNPELNDIYDDSRINIFEVFCLKNIEASFRGLDGSVEKLEL